MNAKAFHILEEVATRSFSEPYAGLRTMLSSRKNFSKYVEKNYRIKKFLEEHAFYMTRNEIDFHFIGFMDAILWLSRSNMLKRSEDKIVGVSYEDDLENGDDEIEYSEEELKKNAKGESEKRAIWNYIIYYETGEDCSFE